MDKKTVSNHFSKIFTKSLMFMKNIAKKPQVHFILLGVVLIALGRSVAYGSNPPNLNFIAEVLILTVVALGMNLLLGFSGLVSLSTAAFMGVTVHMMNILVNTYEVSFLMAALLSLITAGILGLVIGLLSFRMEGIYLAIATLFVGHIITEAFRAFAIFNNGESKRIFPAKGANIIGDYHLSNFFQDQRLQLYYLVVVGLVIAFIVTYNIAKSPTGRALMAISRAQHAALAMGISVRKYRLLAFVVATMLASFGGVLYAMYFQALGTADSWGIGLSLLILSIVVIGGMKSMYGMLLGAFLIIGVPPLFLRDVAFLSGLDDILTGLLVVLVILYYPYGAAQIFYDIKNQFIKLKAKFTSKVVKPNE